MTSYGHVTIRLSIDDFLSRNLETRISLGFHDVIADVITPEAYTDTLYTSYVDQQTLKPDDDYVLPHQRLSTFDVLVCPLSATERFLLQPLVCGTVFHRTSLLSPLSPSSAVILNHISSHFLIPLSDSSLIGTVPAQ